MDLGFGPCFYPAGDKKSLLPGEKPGETPFFPGKHRVDDHCHEKKK